MDEIKLDKQIETDKSKNSVMKSILFYTLMLAAIGALVAAIITIRRYGAMLKNPLGYNLAQFKIASCTCLDSLGKTFQVFPIK
jgi:hypothetical protein